MQNLVTMASGSLNEAYSGTEIATLFAEYGAEFNASVPFVSTPFPNFTSKATAIQNNLQAFTEEQQFKIIKDLCERVLTQNPANKDVAKVLKLLLKNYGSVYSSDKIDRNIINETNTWLAASSRAKKEFEKAIQSYDNSIYNRYTLDSIRLAFEFFMQDILKNSKSLENQPIDGELLPLLRKKGLPKEIINLVRSIIKGLISYQNENVKHSQTFTDLEVEFVIEQTSILMKLFAKIEKIEKES
ncbi:MULTISPECIES: hypothetical protein [Enterococcus]|uniref:hypothetical protein n=1 Tax=Enterococcus TaxID=1350 RepID=UPI000BBC16B7|nr:MULTISPECIES: hypothetical protein [Enterococcus]EGO9279020.1 hypothetical protein [Enterococcus faecalis]EGP5118261.1 hypothetical protein [Enterococcus faecium]NTQ82352.1 hypothetical protein [Enterococcus faecium]PCE11328.1 hypothetical protein CKY17_12855 [Enterococcus faecium]HAP4485266.1 hypothetical protein [Enterococcus faecalis]